MAQKTTSFALTAEMEAVIVRAQESGMYSSASEVMREALRLFDERRARVMAWRKLLSEAPEDEEELSLSERKAIESYEQDKADGIEPTELTALDLL